MRKIYEKTFPVATTSGKRDYYGMTHILIRVVHMTVKENNTENMPCFRLSMIPCYIRGGMVSEIYDIAEIYDIGRNLPMLIIKEFKRYSKANSENFLADMPNMMVRVKLCLKDWGYKIIEEESNYDEMPKR